MKVLIIEDEATLSSAYQLILEKAGHVVTVAPNGQLGLAEAVSNPPDLILLDLLMPVMSGIEFLKQFKPPKSKPPKIIILSNMGDEKLVDEARDLGAHKYIVKAHTSPNQLIKVVNHLQAA